MRANLLSELFGSILNSAFGTNSPVKIITIVEITVSSNSLTDSLP